jgi:2-hydroxychromene-2-carboxylate isomerase
MTMDAPLDFYFDFSSPYAYLATKDVDALAARHHRTVNWKPVLLGVVFRTTGSKPLTEIPLRGDYMRRDVVRSAKRLGLPFAWPTPFPIATIAVSRAFYWLDGRDPTLAKLFARAAFKAFFADGRDITQPETVAEIASHLGVDKAALLAGIQEQRIKDRLKDETEGAVKKGVFGSPFFIADGEPFWGHDRMAELDQWLGKKW